MTDTLATNLALRSMAHHERDHKGNIEIAAMLEAAADEIEKLQTMRDIEVEHVLRLQKISSDLGCPIGVDMLDWFQAEIERLREEILDIRLRDNRHWG